MDVWRDIRLRARHRHREASVSNGLTPATAIVAAGLRVARLQVDRFEPGVRYKAGVLGVLEREDGFVRLASNLTPEIAAVVAAHELGHNWLYDDAAFMIRDVEAGFGGSPVETGADRVVAYSPRQRLEVQADVFAQEFLLPADRLRQRLVAGDRPSTIAAETGLPIAFVRMQAIRALLLPPLVPPVVDERPRAAPPPDPEQREAAEWDHRPLILDAGPGTGKTRTLVARVKHLLEGDTPASSILALTFSNRAAAEMLERIEALNVAGTPLVWVGTFHAFGLELLHLYHAAAGLPDGFEVLDETGALGLLEGMLLELGLRHYQNLWDPTLELRPILRAISRAKDELVSADEYAAAARETEARAVTPVEKERAGKVGEIARVYQAYQSALRERGAVDFGDLVYLAAKLLSDRPDIREEVRGRYGRILVDEYQDVNQASTALLDQLSDGARHVWVVADPRQSIYRFRGAAPTNAARFTERYPGAERRHLKTNYRSCETVVRVFERFGMDMAAAPKPAVTWKAHRGRVGFADAAHAPDLPSEAAAMRDRIERLRAEGIPYDQQAVLARTHLSLARFSRLLQDLGVPVLYLGDLFERPEIRDLLALVSLGADPAGAGLVRVAGFPEYGATRHDALKVIAEAAASGQDVIAVCARAAALPGLSERGGIGMVRLAAHLSGVEWTTTAWRMLATYLLEASDYLKPHLDADDARSRQRLVAIYQLLKFAREHADATQGRGGRRRFLEDIRRLERLDDDRQFRTVPPEADGLPAVRMMTIHASKGLEFRAVHLPQTATRYVPGPRRPSACPVPLGLEHLEVQPGDHAAEEECLFFVALSRARDVLSVSSASTYTGRQSTNPSKFLKPLASVLGAARAVAPHAPVARSTDRFVVPPRETHEERHLETYMKCPARYRHEVVEGLSALAEKSAYLRFHGCVRQVLAWVGDKACAGEAVTAREAVAYLDGVWRDRGPSGGFEAVYLAEAHRMVSAAATVPDAGHRAVERVLSVGVAGQTVVVRPDRVLEAPDGSIVIRRFRTGRRSKTEEEKPVWALLAAAGEAAFLGRTVHLQAFYPAMAEIVPIVPRRDGTELAPYADALAGVARGAFEPITSRDCPTCQFYFICTAEDSF
ncbi:ATP-dependent helicase [Methylobacterium sp. WL19]|uniref:ATP-dependent helicase n=1 Tax=Methylobacterium sp. WL19 TaxID=2603896 RepID=UPI00165071A2|nr:ATP-dependent helicase [Methylobacterium sp. WL19]